MTDRLTLSLRHAHHGDCTPTRRTRAMPSAVEAVFENADLMRCILVLADLDAREFARVSGVSSAFRLATLTDGSLLLAAAKSQEYMTRHVFMGLFGLDRAEAAAFPCKQRARWGGGHFFEYDPAISRSTLDWVGGMEGRRWRLKVRARRGF